MVLTIYQSVNFLLDFVVHANQNRCRTLCCLSQDDFSKHKNHESYETTNLVIMLSGIVRFQVVRFITLYKMIFNLRLPPCKKR